MTGPVFLIGLGPVGVSIGRSLREAGVRIAGAFDRDASRAGRASALLGVGVDAVISQERLAQASTVMASVSDGEVFNLARQMAEQNLAGAHQVWLHCSGVLPADALSPLAGVVRGIGSMHPAAVFPPGTSAILAPGVCFAVDGDEAAREVARDLVGALGGVPVDIPGDKRVAYHCAMVMGSNYLVTLMSSAGQLLRSCGLPDEDAEKLISGLSSSAVAAAGAHGIDASLSGPIRRGDLTAIRSHLKELRHDEEALRLYIVLAQATVTVASKDGGMDADVADRIRNLLSSS